MRCYQYLSTKASSSDFQVFCPSKHYLHLNVYENLFMQSSVLYLHQFSSYQAAPSVSACPTTRKPGLLQLREKHFEHQVQKRKTGSFLGKLCPMCSCTMKLRHIVLSRTKQPSSHSQSQNQIFWQRKIPHIFQFLKKCMGYREQISNL